MQLQQAQSNQFDHHIHVEYEWRLRRDDLYDSDDDFEDKVTMTTASQRLAVFCPLLLKESYSFFVHDSIQKLVYSYCYCYLLLTINFV